MAPRGFKEHTTLLCTFAEHVDALSPDAWQRLLRHCQPLAGSTPEALLARAQLLAAPQITPDVREAPAVVRAIPSVVRAVSVAIRLTEGMVTSAFPSVDELPPKRRTSTGRADFDRRQDAWYMLEHALARHGVRVPSVATAVRAAANAVSRHDWMPASAFRQVYQWVDTELPYAQIDPDAAYLFGGGCPA